MKYAVNGFAIIAILGAFLSTGLIPAQYQYLIQLVLFLGTVGMLFAMASWSNWYIIGYIAMGLLLINSGIMDPLKIAIFIIAGVLVLLNRFGILNMIFEWITRRQ